MACPDETTIAAFIEAELPADRAACVEQHIDQCVECAALLASLGRVYGPQEVDAPIDMCDPSIDAPDPSIAPPLTPASVPLANSASARLVQGDTLVQRNLALQLAMCLVHISGSVLLIPIIGDSLRRASSEDNFRTTAVLSAGLAVSDTHGPITTPSESLLTFLATLYMVFWIHLGLGWTVVNAYGLARRKRWARWTSLAYAALSLPTGFGTLTSAYTLWSLMRPEAIDALARRAMQQLREQPANTNV